MNIRVCLFATCCCFNLLCEQAAAFVIQSQSALRATSSLASGPPPDMEGWFPLDFQMEKIQGEKSLRTYTMPVWAERCQMFFVTDGRPLKAKAELWLGPLRRIHMMDVDSMDGLTTPYRSTIKFKKGGPVLKISTTASQEFPVLAGVYVPSPNRSKEVGSICTSLWKENPKTKVQGGSISGGGGAVRTWVFDANVESIQVMCWSVDVGKKSLKADIEIYQGPGEAKQTYDLQCGGGTQPFHAIFELPEGSSMVRMKNKKFLEDGLFEVVVEPYTVRDDEMPPIDIDIGAEMQPPTPFLQGGPPNITAGQSMGMGVPVGGDQQGGFTGN